MASTTVAAPEGRKGGTRPSGRPSARRGGVASWLLPLAPALFLMLVFFAGPIIWTVWVSFTNAALTGVNAAQPEFVGLANFTELFADPKFREATLLTVVFLLGSGVVGQTVLGLGLALLLQNRHPAARMVVSTVVVGAWVVPEVVAGLLWVVFLEREGGLNGVFEFLGAAPVNWLYTAPLFAVILANVWKGTAFSMMTYSAGLSEIPSYLKEAARVDGASTLQVVWHIVLPLLRRTIATTLMLVTLQTVQVFTLIYVMTAGGPGERSTTLPLLMYKEALQFGDLGYGTTVALALLIVAGLFSAAYVKMLRPEEVR
ncbi:carbohydrate ABC transporter membrane protein 1 (CUT1 family) [Murinocardiopsis flavida]|uniref:Carbohydrate ABC transporter membrane protein 1 (CUT1 family) n=2 Tax=Murinocardiopsis flavida TaxID=645275 RepID=A0A2P8D2A9_9ACTN|nr:sugar ABC transporter permease [Murinocardiopsis flavida]PSK91364.1 carbohydrate ABC transporter membrane protein 1 (CUT1 family) [Murinocardiopsis flavida]